MPPRSAPSATVMMPTYDFTGRRVRAVPPPPPSQPLLAEPSPLLAAIRAYLERA
jgi:hypothetical protein